MGIARTLINIKEYLQKFLHTNCLYLPGKKQLFLGFLIAALVGVSVGSLSHKYQFTLIILVGVVTLTFLVIINPRICLFGLLIGMLLYSRKFSHFAVQVGNLPLYVTEGVLLLTLILYFLVNYIRGKVTFTKTPLNLFLSIYLVFGAFELVRGFPHYGLEALRDSVLVYYGLFFFVFLWTTKKVEQVERYFCLTLICIAVIDIFLILKVINQHFPMFGGQVMSQFPLGNEIFYGFGAIFYLASFNKLKRYRKISFLILIFPLLFNFLTYFRRSLFLGVVISALFVYFFNDKVSRIKIKRITLLCALPVLMAIIIWGSSIPNLWRSHASGAWWRMVVWGETMSRISEKPIFGWGMGPPIVKREMIPDFARTNDPHNSFLAILFRMGMLGFGTFMLLLFIFYLQSIRFLLATKDSQIRAYVLGLLGCHIFMIVFSFFNVVLEGPHHGIWFWIIMGLTIALIKMKARGTKEIV